ncbi:T-cell receptor-associated transmembrane adapter 1 [Emydura macquarii macquarii]|uniref:T-cell receptor-associated transmembrane adapter 1 n=1 Tax=Emydura macquarii macquarii TaxID=1129001 RepID=UPI00352B0A60
MEIVECHFSIWGLLAFLTLALVVSLIINISYCIANKQRGHTYKNYQEYSPSYDDYTEDSPVYGNLNQEILEDCCYEQMKAQPRRHANEVKVETEGQMCYASLNHSIKEKHRKPRKKKAPAIEVNEEEIPSKTSTLASQTSIYLNSHQLAAENNSTEEAIHDDPIRLFGLIHTT